MIAIYATKLLQRHCILIIGNCVGYADNGECLPACTEFFRKANLFL